MKGLVRQKGLLAWLIVFCMVMSLGMPMFAYAQEGGLILVDGDEYAMSRLPEENEIGLMVSVEDIANALALEYDYDGENKAVTLWRGEQELLFVHNASTYSCDGEVIDCEPCFYVTNGEALIEVGFLSELLGLTYEYDSELQTISFVSDEEEVCNEEEVVDEEVVEEEELPETVMDVVTKDNSATVLSGGEGDEEAVEEEEFPETVMDVVEKDNSATVLGGAGEDEWYEDDVVYPDVTGHIYCFAGAPKGGLEVRVILQQIGTRYYMGYTQYVGKQYILDTITIPEGDTSAQFELYTYDYYVGEYRDFALYFETDVGIYGYYGYDEDNWLLDEAPSSNNVLRDTAYQFDQDYYYSGVVLNIPLPDDGGWDDEEDYGVAAEYFLADVSGRPGDLIEVQVSLQSDENIDSIGLYAFDYDSTVLQFVGFDDYEHLDSQTILPPAFDTNKMTAVIALKNATAFNGDLFTMKFKIRDNVPDQNTFLFASAVTKNKSDVVDSYVYPAMISVTQQILGDINGDESVDVDDAVLLFQHSMLPDLYPIDYVGSVDFNKDGTVDVDDAVLLFQYSMLPDLYPIG